MFEKKLETNPYFELISPFDDILIKDEIALEDFINRMVVDDPTKRINRHIYIQVFRRDSPLSCLSNQFREQEGAPDMRDPEDRETTRVYQVIQDFILGKSLEDDDKVKEIEFIKKANLPRELAKDLDISKRLEVEEEFPILKKYNTLCFKPKAVTFRRLLVYPSNVNYYQYMQDMRSLTEKSEKWNEKLNSRVKILFKGKFVLRIDDTIFTYFEDLINNTVYEHKIESFVRPMLKRKDLHLMSSNQSSESLRNCSSAIMKILSHSYIELDDIDMVYGNYHYTCERGREIIEGMNRKYKGTVFLRFDIRKNKLVMNGKESDKKDAERDLRDR